MDAKATEKSSLRLKLHEIIYEADTKPGKLFDIALLIIILISILLVMLESVQSIYETYGDFLDIAEWVITLLFSLEYILRIVCVKKPWKYIFSFYGIVDFLSTLPKYLSLILANSHQLAVLRAIRLLRVFRILKIPRYVGASDRLLTALHSSRAKITVFLLFILILCMILGTVMYMVEEPENGFTSIPKGVYWAIVTLTSVGYGDMTPVTALGQLIASAIMILGYAIIAVPTGIISSEMIHSKIQTNTQVCPSCMREGHKNDALFCYHCGDQLNG